MPSDGTSRRRLLAGLGSATTAALAGCTSRLPGAGPERIDAESTVEDRQVLWKDPPREGDRDGIGYASVDAERLYCSFTVQASRPGTFGRTVRVSDQAVVGLDTLGWVATRPRGRRERRYGRWPRRCARWSRTRAV